jgi:hypothetical protein
VGPRDGSIYDLRYGGGRMIKKTGPRFLAM